MRNRLRVAAFDVLAPVAVLAALIYIGVALRWPLWWVSVCSVLSLLVVQAVVVNFVLARRDKVTVGTIPRAYREAERRGLVEAKVGSGTRVRSLAADAPAFHHLSHAPDGSVDLSLNVPIPHPMRAQQLAAVMERLAHRPGAIDAALAYQPEQGSQTSREALAGWLTEQGVPMGALL